MPEKHLYEYAVIRFVPKVEREEFLNIGIVLFSKQARYLNAIYVLNEQKLRVFSTEVDMECLKNALQVFDKVCQGKKEGGSIAQMEIPDRFRWLTAVRSACIQTSRPHLGFSMNLDATLQQLFKELVL